MDNWINSLIQGQEIIIRLVQENYIMGEVVEFSIGLYVLVEEVQRKSKLMPFPKGPMEIIEIKGDIYLLHKTRQRISY
jgi:hypothetical protein